MKRISKNYDSIERKCIEKTSTTKSTAHGIVTANTQHLSDSEKSNLKGRNEDE